MLGQIVKRTTQLVSFHRTLAQLATQLVDEFTVLLHRLLNELDVLLNALLHAGTLTLTGHAHTVLSGIDGTEAFFNVIQRSHHVIDFVVLLCDDTI